MFPSYLARDIKFTTWRQRSRSIDLKKLLSARWYFHCKIYFRVSRPGETCCSAGAPRAKTTDAAVDRRAKHFPSWHTGKTATAMWETPFTTQLQCSNAVIPPTMSSKYRKLYSCDARADNSLSNVCTDAFRRVVGSHTCGTFVSVAIVHRGIGLHISLPTCRAQPIERTQLHRWPKDASYEGSQGKHGALPKSTYLSVMTCVTCLLYYA